MNNIMYEIQTINLKHGKVAYQVLYTYDRELYYPIMGALYKRIEDANHRIEVEILGKRFI